MDYAEVMKDLGVHGSAKVDQNLEVGGTSTLKGDVTMESNATVKKNLTVGGNATIAGDVTARSYKVDGKTYINADGINANDQKITNVADGSISVGSKDAVNGGQLYGVKRDLEHQVDKVGANAAAMANCLIIRSELQVEHRSRARRLRQRPQQQSAPSTARMIM